jgi:hypothetical protein
MTTGSPLRWVPSTSTVFGQVGQGVVLVVKDGKIVPVPVPGPEPILPGLTILIRNEIRNVLNTEFGSDLKGSPS